MIVILQHARKDTIVMITRKTYRNVLFKMICLSVVLRQNLRQVQLICLFQMKEKPGEIPSVFVSAVGVYEVMTRGDFFFPLRCHKNALQERGQNENPEQLPILPLWDIYYLIRSALIRLP